MGGIGLPNSQSNCCTLVVDHSTLTVANETLIRMGKEGTSRTGSTAAFSE